jgi:hypothetical protein
MPENREPGDSSITEGAKQAVAVVFEEALVHDVLNSTLSPAERVVAAVLREVSLISSPWFSVPFALVTGLVGEREDRALPYTTAGHGQLLLAEVIQDRG